MNAQSALAQDYARARYEIRLADATYTRRIGIVDPVCDARLSQAGCQHHWFIVTACNPQSQRQDEAGNAARLAAMAQQLHDASCTYVHSLASAEDGTWPEAGFCIFDLAEREVRALARQYRQHAIVSGVLGEAPTLIWLDPAADGQ